MEYSIGELSELAGVSARTLRYYDAIGLLKPLYVSDVGYRYYGEEEVALLQQILFYRERGFHLEQIRKIIYQDDFDIIGALNEHLLELEERRNHVDSLIRTVRQTIAQMKGEGKMSDAQKFEAFKEGIVRENEEQYGTEVSEKYGDRAIDLSHRKLLDMSEEDYEKFENLGGEIKKRLTEGIRAGIQPDGDEAKRIVLMHKEWLAMTWETYTGEAHKGVADLYVTDERFRMYYDQEVPGCAELLKQAVRYWADRI